MCKSQRPSSVDTVRGNAMQVLSVTVSGEVLDTSTVWITFDAHHISLLQKSSCAPTLSHDKESRTLSVDQLVLGVRCQFGYSF